MQYGGCMEIQTKKGQIILVDESDRELVSKNKWHTTRKGYASSRFGYLHRILLNAPKGMQVDHINGNKLDNRRENLRLATNSQNHANKGLLKNNTSGYKGVWFCDRNKRKWIANIWVNNKKIHIGAFAFKDEAGIAYNKLAMEHFGEYANLNKIGGGS